jgi:hypothetical protein
LSLLLQLLLLLLLLLLLPVMPRTLLAVIEAAASVRLRSS